MTRLLNTFNVRHRRGRDDYLRGAAAAMDLRGNTTRQYRLAATPAEADARAVANDWQTVGDDLRASAGVVEKRLNIR